MPSLTLLDRYAFHGSVVFGFDVQGDGPLVMGCTVVTREGKEIDLRAQDLARVGRVLCHLKAPHETAYQDAIGRGWEGKVMFALWPDRNWNKRLADTGWIPWEAQDLIGSSIKGLEMQEDEMRAKYKDATKVRFAEG